MVDYAVGCQGESKREYLGLMALAFLSFVLEE